MEPVSLPPPNSAEIQLLAQLSNPPTLTNISNAWKYCDEVHEKKCIRKVATDDDLSIQGIQEALEPIFQKIQNQLEAQQGQFQGFGNMLEKIYITSYQSFNASCASGQSRPYKILPFFAQDRTEISPALSGLPLLHTIDDINGLDDNQLMQYLTGYNIATIHEEDKRSKMRKLTQHLGVAFDG